MASREQLKERIVQALREVYDPEIPINVYDLGLIYGIEIDEEGNVEIRMTLTAVGCPMAGLIGYRVEETVRERVPEAKNVRVKIVWDPPWSPEKITSEGREALRRIFGYDVVEEWLRRSRS